MLDPAPIEDRDTVGHIHRFGLVVRDKNGRKASPVVDLPQPLAQILADLGVQCAKRLVEQQHARLDC